MAKRKVIKDNITCGVSKQFLVNKLKKILKLCEEKEQVANQLKAVQLLMNINGFNNGGDPYSADKTNSTNNLIKGDQIQYNLIANSTSSTLKPILSFTPERLTINEEATLFNEYTNTDTDSPAKEDN